ncbi:MAG: Gfo/Idh/MocA family oxidoreductase [Vicinamibacterales bacterium]
MVRWGIIGCGDVTEVKSGPAFQKANGSMLAAVMRRDFAKAEDYARRHGVPSVHRHADDLISDPVVDAVYIATPPSSHCDLALRVAEARKPCLVEKPMALNHEECERMVAAFRGRGVPLWVAYYRRALPRFLLVRDLLRAGALGRLTSVHVEVAERLANGARASTWRFDPTIAGAGLFFDLGSHSLDLVDFLAGPIGRVSGFAANTGGTYGAEDVTAASFLVERGVPGTGIWNFNADAPQDRIRFVGSEGHLVTPIFADTDVVLTRGEREDVHSVRNPAHVHQPLIQTIVDELLGRGRCESTGESGARTSWVMDQCLAGYRKKGTVPLFS